MMKGCFSHRNFLFVVAMMITLSGCVSNGPVKPELRTVLPSSFKKEGESLNKMAVLHPKTLKLYSVKRSKAELRKGPGVGFDLKDVILKKGALGILIEEKGVWRKIIPLENKDSGWVHKKTIEVSKQNSEIEISLRKLPAVVAVKRVERMYDFSTIKQLKVNIPKGTAFVALQKHKWRTLVWLHQTNSLAWVSQRDFR
jgi:hypothetical protein